MGSRTNGRRSKNTPSFTPEQKNKLLHEQNPNLWINRPMYLTVLSVHFTLGFDGVNGYVPCHFRLGGGGVKQNFIIVFLESHIKLNFRTTRDYCMRFGNST